MIAETPYAMPPPHSRPLPQLLLSPLTADNHHENFHLPSPPPPRPPRGDYGRGAVQRHTR